MNTFVQKQVDTHYTKKQCRFQTSNSGMLFNFDEK